MAASSSRRCYPFHLVYPAKGRELQLEQVRAALPQYRYALSAVQEKAVEVCCYPKDRVYPPSGGEFQPEQLRAWLPKYQCSDMEITEIAKTNFLPSPAMEIVDSSPAKESPDSISNKLEELMSVEKPVTTNIQSDLPYVDGFEEALRLQLEQGSLHNQENQSYRKYNFTPDAMDSWSCKGADLVHTKLNFTDTESMLSVSGQRPSSSVVSGFNVTSSLEHKAKLLRSQQDSEGEFPVTEFLRDVAPVKEDSISGSHLSKGKFKRKPLQVLQPQQEGHPMQPHYEDLCDESFIPFHDASLSFRKPKPCERKPLQVLCPSQTSFGGYEDTREESSFAPFHDSMQTSLSSRKHCERASLQLVQTSCVGYGDTRDESSFIPFQDSMQASTCENLPTEVQNPRQYCAPLGVPIGHYDQPLCEQTFTQFDIAHPKSAESVSTPKGFHQHKDFSMDLSVIPSFEEGKRNRSPTSKPGTLTPIKEEPSGSSKLTSSSRFTVSSSNSSSSSSHSCQSVSASNDQECNPFAPDMVNRMLNSLGGVPQDAAIHVLPASAVPAIAPGEILPGHVIHSVSSITKSRSSEVYLVDGGFGQQILQVHNTTSPLEWEVTILQHLRERLQDVGLQELSNSYQKFCQVFRFPTSFISFSAYYTIGSIQTLVEKFYTVKRVIPESFVSYFTLEMLSITGYLHQCGIIHAALKPAHFLVRSRVSSHRGCGLCLIDFRTAIDTKQFPEEQMFTGTPPHLAAVQMEGLWKWQLDYCGLAVCIMSLITNSAGSVPVLVRKDASSGLYTCSKKPSKKYNNRAWQDLIAKLLNAVEMLPLQQLGQSIENLVELPSNIDVLL